MPNWLHLFLNFLYHLGLALWIGGAVTLGALVAPALFRTLPRADAGAIFGPLLRRFSRLRLGAMVLVIGAAAAKQALWESHSVSVWIVIRWLAITVLTVIVFYELLHLEGAIGRAHVAVIPGSPEDDPSRRAFNVLHRRSEALMKLSLGAAVTALFLS